MASKRSIPTDLFWDVTFSSLNSDAQSIFLGLVLDADDYGRGAAEPSILTRKLAKAPDLIAQALQVLHASAFVQCYEVEGKRYYYITSWEVWERLDRRARSRFPAPPESTLPEGSTISPDSPGISGEIRPEVEVEVEEKRREEEAEGQTLPRSVIPFPARSDDGQGKSRETTLEDLAGILHLPATPALARLFTEFPTMSLVGEADAARAWIEDQQRRQGKQHRLTLPFFRRWLQRSQTIQTEHQAAHASSSSPPATRAGGPAGPARLPDLMHLDEDFPKRRADR